MTARPGGHEGRKDKEMKIEVTKQELDLLAEYPSEIEQRDPSRYDFLGQSAATICMVKDRTAALFDKRCQAARDVIDLIARRVGIDPENTGFWLYALDADRSSPIVAKMDDYFSRSGDKVKLKKRIDELEQENSVLRSLISVK